MAKKKKTQDPKKGKVIKKQVKLITDNMPPPPSIEHAYFSNIARVNHGNNIFNLYFGHWDTAFQSYSSKQEAMEIPVTFDLKIVMPPDIAKLLITALQTQVDIYEKIWGKIDA